MILPSAADAPRSPHDTFVLSAARARAAVIVTSGANVRAEPRLTHELIGEGAEGLRGWRGGGQQSRPDTVVLSRDPALDLSHPLFSAGKPAHVLTTAPAALALRYAALPLFPFRSLHAALTALPRWVPDGYVRRRATVHTSSRSRVGPPACPRA